MTRCLCGIYHDWNPYNLFLSLPGDFQALPRSDCIVAEQLCLLDSNCNATYRTLENCDLAKTRFVALDHDSRVRCLNAELYLGNSSLLHCKCHRRMKRQEHCLRIFWTVHSSMTDGEINNTNLEGTSKAQHCPSHLKALVKGHFPVLKVPLWSPGHYCSVWFAWKTNLVWDLPLQHTRESDKQR